jgi:hypothetical protein
MGTAWDVHSAAEASSGIETAGRFWRATTRGTLPHQCRGPYQARGGVSRFRV